MKTTKADLEDDYTKLKQEFDSLQNWHAREFAKLRKGQYKDSAACKEVKLAE